MNSLRDIRQRLRSVENIKKITDTMERVAAARLRHAQIQAEQSRPYITKLRHILEKVAATDVSHPFFEQREVKKIAVVIVSSERGLSGSYNTNIFSAADSFLKNYSHDQVELILLGRKAADYYNNKHWPVRLQINQLVEKRVLDDIKELSDHLVHWYVTGDFDEIWLVYTHYITVMRRQVRVEKFLNIGKQLLHNPLDKEEEKIALNYIFEPSPEEILNEILPRYCFTRIETAIYEAYASELGARIVAMQTASKNSKEMITELTLIKNKTRQRDITREMIEISTGAEGAK